MGVSRDYPVAPASFNEAQQDHNMNLSMLYYSFFVVATAGVLLAIYHCLIIKWCTQSWWQESEDPVNAPVTSVEGFECRKVVELESNTFKYKKSSDSGGGRNVECVVCLSAYEDGEDIRQLLRCKHCFHAHCIDMWLYSHFECPLCRAPVGHIKGLIIQHSNPVHLV